MDRLLRICLGELSARFIDADTLAQVAAHIFPVIGSIRC
jgi:hypothetical protein